jgi:hypothetical protein
VMRRTNIHRAETATRTACGFAVPGSRRLDPARLAGGAAR